MSIAADRKARELADAEIGEILSLAEPFAWTDTWRGYEWMEYELTGLVKLPAPARADLTGTGVRRELLERFEQMLDALGDAGWQPVDSFELDLSTKVRHFTQSLAGTLGEPSQQRGVSMKFTVRLGRPRK